MSQPDAQINEIDIKSLENVSTAYALMYGRLAKSMISYAGTEEIRKFDIGTNDYLDRVFPVEYGSISTNHVTSKVISNLNDLRFLQKHKGESDDNYRRRVIGSFFFNNVRQSIDWMTGRVFSREVQIPDDKSVPEVFTNFYDDVDGQGTSLNKFCEMVFKDALIKGFSSILVDFSEGISEEETLSDSMKKKARFVHIKPENLIAAYRDDSGELYHARIMTNSIELGSGMIEESVNRIFMFEKNEFGEVSFYKFKKGEDDVEYSLESSGVISLSYIPLITFYPCEKEADYVVNNVVNDLVDLNISLYRQMSSYQDTIEKTCFPMLLAKGFNEDEFAKFGNTEVGASKGFCSTNENASLTWTEFSGTAVASASTAILETQNRINALGSDLITGTVSGVTATEIAISSAEQNSRVECMAKVFQNILGDALMVWFDWHLMNGTIEEDKRELVTASIHSDFSFTEKTVNEIKELREMTMAGLLSRNQYMNVVKRTGMLGQDFDISLNDEELSADMDVAYLQKDPDTFAEVSLADSKRIAEKNENI